MATTDRLLRAAELEFAKSGYDGARLADIADHAGIGRSSLLYHYQSKYDLYCAVVQNAFADVKTALDGEIARDAPFDQRLDRIVGRFLDFLEERPAVATLIVREILDRRGPGHSLLLEATQPLLARIEHFLVENGRTAPAGVPMQAAVLHVVSAALLRSAAGPLRQPLWGDVDPTASLAHILFSQGGLKHAASNARR